MNRSTMVIFTERSKSLHCKDKNLPDLLIKAYKRKWTEKYLASLKSTNIRHNKNKHKAMSNK